MVALFSGLLLPQAKGRGFDPRLPHNWFNGLAARYGNKAA